MPGLLDRIDALLAASPPADEPRALLHIENTLTDGYAHALALEGERLRIERQLERAVASSNGDRPGEDLSALSRRMAAIDRDLSVLRARLGILRHRARELRAGLAS